MKKSSKTNLLKEYGYKYVYQQMIFVNPERKKIFSLRFAENNSVNKIRDEATKGNNSGGWVFYFDGNLTDTMKSEILSKLGKNVGYKGIEKSREEDATKDFKYLLKMLNAMGKNRLQKLLNYHYDNGYELGLKDGRQQERNSIIEEIGMGMRD